MWPLCSLPRTGHARHAAPIVRLLTIEDARRACLPSVWDLYEMDDQHAARWQVDLDPETLRWIPAKPAVQNEPRWTPEEKRKVRDVRDRHTFNPTMLHALLAAGLTVA